MSLNHAVESKSHYRNCNCAACRHQAAKHRNQIRSDRQATRMMLRAYEGMTDVNTRIERPEVVQVKLRQGAGIHADKRTKRERDRSSANRKAIARNQEGN